MDDWTRRADALEYWPRPPGADGAHELPTLGLPGLEHHSPTARITPPDPLGPAAQMQAVSSPYQDSPYAHAPYSDVPYPIAPSATPQSGLVAGGGQPPRSAGHGGRGWFRRWINWLCWALAALLIGGVIGAGALLLCTSSVSDAEQRVLAIDQAHGVSETTSVPSRFAAALVATEDSRFYSHPGIDIVGVFRAARAMLTHSSGAGGATLDQQLAKQLYFGGTRGGLATLEQIAMGVKIDATYSKQQILEMYASVVYFGHGFYGLDAASIGYFGVSPDQLSWGQAALLAGLMQAPTAYNPVTHPAAAAAREQHVLNRLVASGQLSSQDATAAPAAPLGLVAGSSSA